MERREGRMSGTSSNVLIKQAKIEMASEASEVGEPEGCKTPCPSKGYKSLFFPLLEVLVWKLHRGFLKEEMGRLLTEEVPLLSLPSLSFLSPLLPTPLSLLPLCLSYFLPLCPLSLFRLAPLTCVS